MQNLAVATSFFQNDADKFTNLPPIDERNQQPRRLHFNPDHFFVSKQHRKSIINAHTVYDRAPSNHHALELKIRIATKLQPRKKPRKHTSIEKKEKKHLD
eukprot:scaffold91366_cov50-Attheya_sp.AAC.2